MSSKLKFGSYEMSAIDFVIISLIAIVVWRFVRKIFGGGSRIEIPRKYQIVPLEMNDFLEEEFGQFAERHDDRCLVVCEDKIFDLSESRELYESNRHHFEQDLNSGEWRKVLERKYPFVGRIVKTRGEKRDYDGRVAGKLADFEGN